MKTYDVIVRLVNNVYVAVVPALPGIRAEGATRDDALLDEANVPEFVAILLPFLIIFFIAGLVWMFVALRRRRRRRRAERIARRDAERIAGMGVHDDRTLDLWR